MTDTFIRANFNVIEDDISEPTISWDNGLFTSVIDFKNTFSDINDDLTLLKQANIDRNTGYPI